MPALTLSASSGTRCCTRSSTYMLECGRELRQSQSGRARTAFGQGLGATARGADSSWANQIERRRMGGLCRPAHPLVHQARIHTALSRSSGTEAAPDQGTHRAGAVHVPFSPSPKVQGRAGRRCAQEPCHVASSQLPSQTTPQRQPPQTASGSTPTSGCANMSAGREDERMCSCHVYGSPGQPGSWGRGTAPTDTCSEHRRPHLGSPQVTREPASQGGLTRSWGPV